MYSKRNQEKFLLQFLKNDALWEEYQAIAQDPDNHLHRVKAISDAIKTSGAKTVTVTVQKNGEELSFRTGTTPLMGHHNSYNTSHIAAADRREFERLFGRHASYTAEDITRITYGKKTLYEAAPIQAEEMPISSGLNTTSSSPGNSSPARRWVRTGTTWTGCSSSPPPSRKRSMATTPTTPDI